MLIKDAEFVVFDVETTGLNANQADKICELGAVKVKASQVVESFNSLVNPLRQIPVSVTAIHGITDKDVAQAPVFKDISGRFLEFIGDFPLLAYNISFDLSFLTPELRSAGKPPITNPCVDILAICRRFLDNLGRFNLSYVAKFLNIPDEPNHRASQDALVAAEAFLNILPRLEEKGITTLNNLYTIFATDRSLIFRINNAKLTIIRQALADEAKLKIKYYSLSQNQLSEREVLPLKIESAGDRILLVGRCLLRSQERNFNLDRILDLAII
jgi:DNA polymerase III epsilon subunit family exonuclease